MTSPTPQGAPSWTMRLRRSWVRWLRTMLLKRTVRKLRRKLRRQERVLSLQVELQELLETLAIPSLSAPLIPPELEIPPPLTEAEIKELREMPMPDPLEEIEYRLGLSTTPPSPQTWEA